MLNVQSAICCAKLVCQPSIVKCSYQSSENLDQRKDTSPDIHIEISSKRVMSLYIHVKQDCYCKKSSVIGCSCGNEREER